MSSSTSSTMSVPELIPPPHPNREIPRFMQYISPVGTARPNETFSATTLPLNLVALIISYLDDISDIARVTRTCRLLYYMTLPQLYKCVHLRSYADMRYVNGRPEGFGSGSPFTMALNGLVTKGHASIVEELKICGKWKESGIEDFSKGRVPDNSMMLNILLRAATDRMTKLQTFCWELDCKPLKTLYQGLGSHSTLTTLSLRFPSGRTPRPSVLIPPMPNLRVFKAFDIDPLCYPDDISLLLLHSKKLEDLRMHFSPRMRREAESTINLDVFFGRCHKAGYKPKIKHFALQNFYGINSEHTEFLCDGDSCTSITILDTFGGMSSDPRTVFVDDTWNHVPVDKAYNFKHIRCNEISTKHVTLMRKTRQTIERLYIVGHSEFSGGSTPNGSGNLGTPSTPPELPFRDPELIALGKDYLHSITRFQGASMRHLLLSDKWALTQLEMSDLFRHCPNIEQLGFAIDTSNHDTLRLLAPFLPKMYAFRLLHNKHVAEHYRFMSNEERMWAMGNDLANPPMPFIRYIGIGNDYIYRIGGLVEYTQDDGTLASRREITMVDREEVKNVAIWKMDTLDINADPVAPFS